MILLCLLAVGWPIAPMNAAHALGNNWGEYQYYGSGSAYLHPGIDVMGITTGQKVYAVQRGIVKAWLTTSAEYHWRLAIADTNLTTDSVNAWLYAHIDPNRFHRNVGDWVNAGDSIGYLVTWPVTGFDHCHFARIKDIGATWTTADWAFVRNPLLLMTPVGDTVKPVFLNAVSGQKFALCNNNTSTYRSPDGLTGNIDIIAKIYDRTGWPLTYKPIWEQLIPYQIDWEVHGPMNKPVQTSFVFKGYLYYDVNVGVVYKDDATCDTRGDYDYRDYYFIVTNTDGDSVIEASDANYYWATASYPDGYYWIVVTAYDAAGNWAKDSMRVRLANGTGVAETTTPDQEKNRPAVSPNPSTGSFTLSNKAAGRVYDAQGRLVAAGRNRFSGLAPGIYFVVYEDNLKSITEKVVVIKP